MAESQLKIIYQDNDLLVIDKPAGKNSDDFEKRIHRLDKDTSGILLIAKNEKALNFFQEQFKERKVKKIYLALVVGNPKIRQGKIETLIGRSLGQRIKQKTYFPHEPGLQKRRLSVTHYKVLKDFKNYSLVQAEPKTGRKHQVRVHLTYLGYPIAGDKTYRFKNQLTPKNLERQFLHASYLKIKLLNNKEKEFKSNLPDNLKKILLELKSKE